MSNQVIVGNESRGPRGQDTIRRPNFLCLNTTGAAAGGVRWLAGARDQTSRRLKRSRDSQSIYRRSTLATSTNPLHERQLTMYGPDLKRSCGRPDLRDRAGCRI